MTHFRYSIKKIFFLVTSILISQASYPQSEMKDATGTWLVIGGNHQITEKWKIPTVGIIRYYNLSEATEFGFFRTGLTYAPNSNYNFTLGAAYLDTQPFDHNEFETLTTQKWIYEEFCYNSNFYRTKISQRMRLEQRWISKPEESIFNARLRYRLQFTRKISKNLYVKAFDEPFFNLKEGNINQNRFYVGLGRKVAHNINVEIGYMKNHIGKNNYDRIRMVFLFKTKLFKNNSDHTTQIDELRNSQ